MKAGCRAIEKEIGTRGVPRWRNAAAAARPPRARARPAERSSSAATNGQRLFYREAGPAGAPAVVLLHGLGPRLSPSSRPGNDLVQLALFADYASNLPLYPKLHAWLRDSGVPMLAVWGRNDEIFRAEGALASAQDAPDAEIHLLDEGHFLLESHLDLAAGHIRGFLERTLS